MNDISTLTLNEIRARINQLEERRFYLSMKDRWTNDDFDLDSYMLRELAQLRRRAQELGAEG